MFKKFVGLFLTCLVFLSPCFASSSLSVYAVYDESRAGEVAMVTAVINKIALTHPTAQITKKPNANFHDLDLADPSVIITAGQFGINFIKSSTIPTHVKVLLCIHQWFDAMNDLHDVYITMPEHAIDETIQDTAKANNLTLLRTVGVLHTMSAEALADENTSAIHLTDAKVGLILGGDAEMPNGKDWQLFSVENARKLANEIITFQKKTGYKILITNGPRTGRSPTAHKNGELDQVSSVFLEELREAGLKKDEDFQFFDFQSGQPSALKAVMKVVLNNKGIMIVPGESTSSISEIMAVMPAVIYENGAMNSTHHVFMNQVIQKNAAVLWPIVPAAELMETYVPLPSQAVNVVADFLK